MAWTSCNEVVVGWAEGVVAGPTKLLWSAKAPEGEMPEVFELLEWLCLEYPLSVTASALSVTGVASPVAMDSRTSAAPTSTTLSTTTGYRSESAVSVCCEPCEVIW